jgi:hypothetical protein
MDVFRLAVNTFGPTQGDQKRLPLALVSLEAPPPLVIWPGAACRGTEAHPDFLLRGPQQHPHVRLSFKESRMKLANATNLDRKSGVAQWRDFCVDDPS